MKISLELLLISCIEEGFHVVNKSLDITQEKSDPDSIATDYLEYLFKDTRIIDNSSKYILHSTSWRYENNNSIVLTYAVYSDNFTFKHLSPFLIKIEDLQLDESIDPRKPRPLNITLKGVVSHALRHLAFLVMQSKDKMNSVLVSKSAYEAFRKINASLAGRIK